MSKFKDSANIIHKNVQAMFIALKRNETPLYAKIACAVCVGYVLSPIDVIPDFIPVLGQLDDIVLFPLLMALAYKLMPKDIIDDCLKQTESQTPDTPQKKFVYSIPIIIMWVLIIFWIYSLVK